ncbi:hypothetical protein [Vulcanisaeta thermophila]|uniref:hypothetical protein n=1 Tax=Vulcanisaeta thermophila TaxID=867917 RepID=UPI0008531C1C|nr:hypothetical protein [Vulcanisaeta thermophila]
MGFNNKSIEELGLGVMRRAYYVLGISIVGLFLVMINWVGLSSVMYYIMTIKRVVLGMTYYVIPMATAMVGFAITQLPSTMLLNRAGNRVPIFLGLLLNGVSMMVTTDNYYTALLLRFLAGMSMGLYLLPTMLLLVGWWSIRNMTRWVQVLYLMAFTTIFVASIPLAKPLSAFSLYLGLASLALSPILLFTAKDAVIIKKAPIMAVMNNPDVLLMGIAFSAPWGFYLSLASALNETTNTALALTTPLLVIPVLYRFRHALRLNRIKALHYSTLALGALTPALIYAPTRELTLAILGLIFALITLLILGVINELVNPLLTVQTISYLLTISSILGSMIGIAMGYTVDHLGPAGWVITGGLIMASSIIYRVLKITL